MTTATQVWTTVLHDYADVLDEHRTMLLAAAADQEAEFDIVAPPTFEPPAELPALPPDLLGWARTLVAQTNGLSALATELTARASPRLSGGAHRGARVVTVERPAALDAML